jgi:hypothetical protein
MNIQEINEKYGKYMWAVANRYHTGIWSPDDVCQQLMQLLLEMPKAERDNLVEDSSRMHSFIISRAINIVRYEKHRKHPHLGDESFEEFGPEATPSPEETELEIRMIKHLLFKRLPKEMAEFIYELAFPSPTTVEIALEDQAKAKADEALRMNVRKLAILPRHVCVYIAYGGGKPPSPATISRWRKKIAEVIYNEPGDYISEGTKLRRF